MSYSTRLKSGKYQFQKVDETDTEEIVPVN